MDTVTEQLKTLVLLNVEAHQGRASACHLRTERSNSLSSRLISSSLLITFAEMAVHEQIEIKLRISQFQYCSLKRRDLACKLERKYGLYINF